MDVSRESQECQLQPGLWEASLGFSTETAVLSVWPRWAGFFVFVLAAPCLSDISVSCPETEPRPWHQKPWPARHEATRGLQGGCFGGGLSLQAVGAFSCVLVSWSLQG